MAHKARQGRRRVKGEPWVWLSGGAVAVGIVMIVGMLTLITVEGTSAFWPHDVEAFVLGRARYNVHHPEHGPAFVARDDSTLVVPARDDAWRTVDGELADAGESAPVEVTVEVYEANRQLFEGDNWRVRRSDGKLQSDLRGEPVTPARFIAGAAEMLSEAERSDFEHLKSRWKVEHRERGQVYIARGDRVVCAVPWRELSGAPVPFDFESPRRATIADYRALPGLFKGVDWLLADPGDSLVRDEDGNPVKAADYLADPERFASPWG
jgi:hypothetical protein